MQSEDDEDEEGEDLGDDGLQVRHSFTTVCHTVLAACVCYVSCHTMFNGIILWRN
jgi:hypothetical protein